MKRLLPVLLVLLAPVAIQAQAGRTAPPPVWTVGVRGGFDIGSVSSDPVVGAVTRIPVRLIPRVSVQVAWDYTFGQIVDEWQIATDAVYDLGGISVGGGPVFRNTEWAAEASDRETRTGFSVFAALGGVPVRGFYAIGLEFRYIRVGDFSPNPFSLGFNVAPGRLF